jgi:D-alanyl-D-alanine carboxypeptidase/D-alanyl-D-alanine-endopeptidase (penicillin-binding protein 4)
MNRLRKLAISVIGLLALAGCPGPADASAATGLAELQADLGAQMALVGPADGAYAYDLTAHEAIFSQRATNPRPPASVEKLYTSVTALTLLGPDGRLPTTVYGVGHMAAEGVWEGDLYLRGGGDPTFGSRAFIDGHYGGSGASVGQLARLLAKADGIRRVTGSVLGDESYFDTNRGEPASGFAPDPFLEGTLSGLAFNRGVSGHEHGAHAPAALAAHELRSALRSAGVTVAGKSGAKATPAGAAPLAQVLSPTIAELLGLMLPPSDNFFAETLLKDIGARFGGAPPGTAQVGTTAAGAGVVRRTIGSLLGTAPRVVDGSGLSRADRTSPYQVAFLLTAIAGTPNGTILRERLAVAGQSGTLEHRMRHTAAAGRCEGKTGTLIGASNLAGYCLAANGHTLVFAIFNDGVSTLLAHRVQDHIVISLAGY